jgi:hemerythrin
MLTWTNDLNTGVAKIDSQHQELFRRIDALLEASKKGQGRAEIAATMAFLEAYVVTHFQDEEQLMRESGYPGYAAHRELHVAFMADLADLKAQFGRDGATSVLVIRVQQRVVAWLRTHIAGPDQAVGRHLLAAAG